MHIESIEVDSEKEAMFLMIYHLRSAALFFEFTPMKIALPEDEFSHKAMVAWVHAMEALYPE